MENEEINLLYHKNVYKFKILYIIRNNLPSSEYVYIIAFFLKYLGLILISISLNEKVILTSESSEKINHISKKESALMNFQKILSKLFCFQILSNNYPIICIWGFWFFILYYFFIIFGFCYMKSKYYNKNMITPLEKKIKKINDNSKLAKRFIKIISYIFFIIVFFHQYIIEFFLIGFLTHLLNLFDVFDTDLTDNILDQSYSLYIRNYFDKMIFNEIGIMAICCISINLVLILFIYFMIINSTKSLFINIGNPFYGNSKFLIIKIIIFNYNPVYAFINMFNSTTKQKIIFVLIDINLILISMSIFISFYNFSFYPSNLSTFCIFIEFFSLFSMFFEVIIFMTESKINSTIFEIIKLLLELFNAFIFTRLFISRKVDYYLKRFSKTLFSEQFEIYNPDDIYFYIEAYIKYSKNKNYYLPLFRIIQSHVLTCYNKDCPCKFLFPKSLSYSPFTNLSLTKLSQEKYNNEGVTKAEKNDKEDKEKKKILSRTSIEAKDEVIQLQNINSIFEDDEIKKENLKRLKTEKTKKKKIVSSKILQKNKNTKKPSSIIINGNLPINYNENEENINNEKSIKNEKNELKNEQFQIIGEQEIVNRINSLYKNKSYSILETYIFVHIQYLIKVKQNFRLALYYIGKYSSYGLKLSFFSRYFLYEIKKYISKNIIQLKNIKLIKDPYIIKYQHENIKIKNLINYIWLYQMIKKLLKISCTSINYFYSFCSDLHNSLSIKKYTKTKIYPIIKSIEKIKSSIFTLKYLIQKYNKDSNNPIESIELNYLISNFFKLINGKISQDIQENITPIIYFKKVYYENLENQYNRFMISNPLIISMTKYETFNIIYFSNIYMEKLGFTYSDLKNSDFHEKIFPGGPEECKEHALFMKQFLFFQKNVFNKKYTFLKSKEKYLVSINFSCKIFPNFTNNFMYIANVIFNDIAPKNFKQTDSQKLNSNINKNDNNIKNYSFLLNHDFDILGMTKNFYLEYDLNQNMIKELKLNFCQFFCINENNLIEHINFERNKLYKKFKNYNNKISLNELNKVYSLFKNISIKDIFIARDDKLLENYFYPTIHVYDKIDKKKLILKIPELLNVVDEIGLDYNWYQKIQNLKNRLINNKYTKTNTNLKESLKITISSDKKIETILKQKRYSSALEQIKNELDNMNSQHQFFEVVYSINKLGSLTYYIVNIYEKIDTTLTGTINKRNSAKINIKNNNNSKEIKKLNRFLTIDTTQPEKETPNKEQNNEHIKRKAKTKVFFSQVSKKKNSLFIPNSNNISLGNSLLNIIKFSSKKDLKRNITNSDSNTNDLSKKINSTDENHKNINKNETFNEININNLREEKTRKNTKNYDNSEYLKKLATFKKEKENFEDEENSFLITKDKFNEELIINNKKNKIFIIIVYSVTIFALIINLTKCILSLVGFEDCKTVLKISIVLEMIKIDIYAQGILSIIYCINQIENITSNSKLQSEEQIKIKSTMNHIKIFQDLINAIVNNKYCSRFFEVLNEEFNISSLNDDWSYIDINTNLLEEIRSLNYKLNRMLDSNVTCNINSTFYIYSNFTSELYTSGKLPKANQIQKILFYFLNNTFHFYQKMLDKLSEETAKIIQKIWYIYLYIIFIFITTIIIIIAIFSIIFIIKIYYDYSYYQLLLLYYYNIENEQLKFKNQIFYLNKTIQDFNKDSIEHFEYIKMNPNINNDNNDNGNVSRIYSNFIKNTKNILINNNSNTDNNNNINQIRNSSKKKRNKRDSYPKNMKENNNLNNKNNMSLSFLNGSMNGSSLHILNNNNNNKLNLNNNSFINNNRNEKEEKQNVKEESVEYLLKFSRKILPNSIKLSIIAFIILFLISIISCSINIVLLMLDNNQWNNSINLSMNVLERIPKMMSLLIYACLTLIKGNQYIIEGSPYNNNQADYIKYFKANSLYFSKDLMDKYFSDNYFGELLRDTMKINYNFNNFFFLETNNIFFNTKKWESLLRIGGYFCINAGIGEVLSFQNEYTLYDFTKEINYYANLCLSDSTGIDESGVNQEIDFILDALINKFIEFVTHNTSNITLNQARNNFFGSSNIKRIINDMILPLIFYYNTISYAIDLDFTKKNKEIVFQQIEFSLFLLFINIVILVLLLISFHINEKYKKLFSYFAEIPNSDYNYQI